MINKFILLILLIIQANLLKCQEFSVDTSLHPKDIVQHYFISKNHQGIKIDKIKYTGLKNGLGVFFYKGSSQSLSPNGIVLSTGSVIDAMGPNNYTASNENYLSGDPDLSKIANSKTFDTAILEFDFMSLTDSIHFSFQFASEEYPEYVSKGVSDVFGFFVIDSSNNKYNIATINKNGVPITVDLINSNFNSDYYIANNSSEYKFNGDENSDLLFYENKRLFQFDGFTKAIGTGLKLEAFKTYHFKIAIADVGDRKFDSWIFLKGNSFVSNGKIENPELKNINAYFNFLKNDSIEFYQIGSEIHMIMPVLFDFNSCEILNKSVIILEPIINLLWYSNYNLIINGYADEVGSSVYNLNLSQKRSDKVKAYFINQGVNQNRLKSYGKGELKSSENNMKSRKVEFILN